MGIYLKSIKMECRQVENPPETQELSTIDGIGGHAKPVMVRYRATTSSGTAAEVFATREEKSMRFSVELLLL